MDVLFWVGCAGSYDERAKKISRSFAELMQIAGVNFRILGTEENCTGDVARRTGNEYLADMLTKTNIETFNRYNVDSGILVDADIVINDRDFLWDDTSTTNHEDVHVYDLQNTMTHELGHAIGLAHSDVEASTMFATG